MSTILPHIIIIIIIIYLLEEHIQICSRRTNIAGATRLRISTNSRPDIHIGIYIKFYGDRPRGTPLPGELDTRGVVKHSDFGPIEGYISETVQGRR